MFQVVLCVHRESSISVFSMVKLGVSMVNVQNSCDTCDLTTSSLIMSGALAAVVQTVWRIVVEITAAENQS